MRMVDLIHKKKAGEALSREELAFFIDGMMDGSIPDYQTSAFAMAVLFKGMDDRETADLTDIMAHSGDMLDLSEFGTLTVDKHSTGGVGDKTTLILAPLVAACGAKVGKMSGRGLGHTGGTVDKLESIPGYRSELEMDDFLRQTRDIGVTVIGQSKDMAPADKKLYALRDVTGTVDSIPLIVSSIMSKKLAAGTHSIVLDVTVGSGAFMKDLNSAAVLAEKMVHIGRACGRRMAALITNMDEPLGRAVGNALEVQEAVSVLKGKTGGDLKEVTLKLASAMLALSLDMEWDAAEKLARETLESGRAYEKFREWIAYQGGDISYLDEMKPSYVPYYTREVYAPRSGCIARMETEAIGNVAASLGAGRSRAGDTLDFAAGLYLNVKTGEYAEKGQRIAVLYAEKPELLPAAEEAYLKTLSWSDGPVEAQPLVYKIIM